MSKYKEEENESYLPLWEDIELRGFLPLQPAQAILDFSRKQHSVGGDSSKEKMIRIKRILAAGKALANVVIVDHKKFTFDLQVKRFSIGTNPQTSEVPMPSSILVSPIVATFTEGVQPAAAQDIESEEDDEVIVFKPVINENRSDFASKISPQNTVDSGESSTLSLCDPTYYNGLVLADEISPHPQAGYISRLQTPASAPIMPNFQPPASAPIMPNFQPTTSQSSIWSMNQPAASLVNELEVANSLEMNLMMNSGIQETTSLSHPSIFPTMNIQQSTNGSMSNVQYNCSSVTFSGINSASGPVSSRRSPVKRPVRHRGPPPGFGSVPSKLAIDNK